MPLRVGVVAYLNAIPLWDDLRGAPDLEMIADSPARIADALACGEIDVGLAPVVEAFRHGLTILPTVGVAGRGAVRSVLLLSRVPTDRIGSVALDPSSRTSAALVQLLLRRRLGLRPELVPGPLDGPPIPDGVDAGLVIGDRAMRVETTGFETHDLGDWWWQETSLPFVFAAWAGADPVALQALAPRFEAALEHGLAHLDELAEREAPRRDLGAEVARSYLREAIRYRLDDDDRRGLTRFAELLREEALLPPSARFAVAS